jgi:hypothetical protein
VIQLSNWNGLTSWLGANDARIEFQRLILVEAYRNELLGDAMRRAIVPGTTVRPSIAPSSHGFGASSGTTPAEGAMKNPVLDGRTPEAVASRAAAMAAIHADPAEDEERSVPGGGPGMD